MWLDRVRQRAAFPNLGGAWSPSKAQALSTGPLTFDPVGGAMTWYWVAGIAVVVILGVLSRRGERPGSSTRPPGAPPTEAQIYEYLRAGRKIEAIKLYRKLHHVDLKAAKDAIDARNPGEPHDRS